MKRMEATSTEPTTSRSMSFMIISGKAGEANEEKELHHLYLHPHQGQNWNNHKNGRPVQ